MTKTTKTPKATKKRAASTNPSKAKSKPAVRSTAKKTLAEGPPVTLEEAQALARATHPRRSLRRAATPTPTPASVGAERERLQKAQQDERDRRLREYTDTMEIMKRRGARTPKAAVRGRRRGPGATAAAAFQPLQMFAEGDSWFDYPYPLFGGGIIPRLQKRLGVPILNMADAGDEVRFMLGVEQRKRLIDCLKKGCPAGGPWDVLLFSGGGNDIVDNPMALWVRDWNPTLPPKAHLDPARFAVALAMVRAGYEDLIALRDKYSPNTHVVLHGYDFAIPDGRGVCHLGPWLKPTFDLRGFTTRAAAQAVVTEMLTQFAAMLQTLTSSSVTFVSTQGTLPAQINAWHNELHPAKPGFDKFADLFRQHLKALFPTRVA